MNLAQSYNTNQHLLTVLQGKLINVVTLGQIADTDNNNQIISVTDHFCVVIYYTVMLIVPIKYYRKIST